MRLPHSHERGEQKLARRYRNGAARGGGLVAAEAARSIEPVEGLRRAFGFRPPPIDLEQMSQDKADGVPQEGDLIAGKYRIESVLGKGGMGIVVAAHHTTLRQPVAIKFLLPTALGNPESVERFLREARSAASIQSEHVARVVDIGTLETGAPYLVMEYLTGVDLKELLRVNGPLPVAEAVDYVLQACEAIAEAHSRGIVHRDLKPSNIFRTSHADGIPLIKVLDFGLSKVLSSHAEVHEVSLTATNMVMGSVHYMSPEQLRNMKEADARADLWAIGAILYQLITGRRPFDALSLPDLCLMIATDPPEPIRAHLPDAPDGLEAVILRCLEKDRDRRMQAVWELAEALLPFGTERAALSVERILRCQRRSLPGGAQGGVAPASLQSSPGLVGSASMRGRMGTPSASASMRSREPPAGSYDFGDSDLSTLSLGAAKAAAAASQMVTTTGDAQPRRPWVWYVVAALLALGFAGALVWFRSAPR